MTSTHSRQLPLNVRDDGMDAHSGSAIALLTTLVGGLVLFFAKGFFGASKQRVDDLKKDTDDNTKAIAQMATRIVAEVASVKNDIAKSHSRTKERHIEVVSEMKLLSQNLQNYTAAVSKLEGKVEANTAEIKELRNTVIILSRKADRLFEIAKNPDLLRDRKGA